MALSPFFTLHSELEREGPGDRDSLARVLRAADLQPGAQILDAACGPGADIAQLLNAADGARVTGIDAQVHFVSDVQRKWPGDDRVTAIKGDMLDVTGAFDFIWCAGAIYFHGIEPCLVAWEKVLKPGGTIGFSTPAFFVDNPGDMARAFWGDCAGLGTAAQISGRISAIGWQVKDHFALSDAAWDNYYGPMARRVAMLQARNDPVLEAVLAEEANDIATWPKIQRETGYEVFVVRKS